MDTDPSDGFVDTLPQRALLLPSSAPHATSTPPGDARKEMTRWRWYEAEAAAWTDADALRSCARANCRCYVFVE
jgi:hypothetical protein